MKSSMFGLLMLTTLVSVGCGSQATPDGAVKAIADGISRSQPQAAWDQLPPSYQKDVNQLVVKFAGKMDKELWDNGFKLAQKLLKVLKEKKQFILEIPPLKAQLAQQGVDEKELTKNWNVVVDMFSTLVNSDISSLDKLKKFDVRKFLAGPGAKLMKQMSTLSALTKTDDFNKALKEMKDVKVTLIKTEGDTATVKIQRGSQEPKEEQMVKVEGKWIPKTIADQWKVKMLEAQAFIEKIKPEEVTKNKEMILAQMKSVDALLDQLLAAKTQEKFNQVVMGFIGGLMGGFGGPPPGPGPPGPPPGR